MASMVHLPHPAGWGEGAAHFDGATLPKGETFVSPAEDLEERFCAGLAEFESPKPESTEGRPLGQPLKKLLGAPLNLG